MTCDADKEGVNTEKSPTVLHGAYVVSQHYHQHTKNYGQLIKILLNQVVCSIDSEPGSILL